MGGVIISKLIKLARTTLVLLSYALLIFGIYAWITELRISGSEWLPIMISSSMNLLLLFIYRTLGVGYIKPSNTKESRIIRVLARIGFGGNIALLIFCILIVIGFGIIP